jgi:hypothetical protein
MPLSTTHATCNRRAVLMLSRTQRDTVCYLAKLLAGRSIRCLKVYTPAPPASPPAACPQDAQGGARRRTDRQAAYVRGRGSLPLPASFPRRPVISGRETGSPLGAAPRIERSQTVVNAATLLHMRHAGGPQWAKGCQPVSSHRRAGPGACKAWWCLLKPPPRAPPLRRREESC